MIEGFVPNIHNPLVTWIGVVESISKEDIFCTLYEDGNMNGIYEISHMPLKNMSDDFAAGIQIGRIFFMAIGEDIDGNAAIDFQWIPIESLDVEEAERRAKLFDSVINKNDNV